MNPPFPLPVLMAVRDQLAQSLGPSVYDCIRTWSAWWEGTMSEEDFIPVKDDDSRMDDLAKAVVMACWEASSASGEEAFEKVHDAFLTELGTVYYNDRDLNREGDFSRISEDGDWTAEMTFEALRRAIPHAPPGPLLAHVVDVLRTDARWAELAELAFDHHQPASRAWLQEAGQHLGEALLPAHQDLLRALNRQADLQNRPTVVSPTLRSRRRS